MLNVRNSEFQGGSLLLRLLGDVVGPLTRKESDLELSNKLVKHLKLPSATEKFVLALKDPVSNGIVYVVGVQQLSERSVQDTCAVIHAARPVVVVAQVDSGDFQKLHPEVGPAPLEGQASGTSAASLRRGSAGEAAAEAEPSTAWQPSTTPAGVLVDSFRGVTSSGSALAAAYEGYTRDAVARAIFGAAFYEHSLAARNLARERGVQFFFLERPKRWNTGPDDSEDGTGQQSAEAPDPGIAQPLGSGGRAGGQQQTCGARLRGLVAQPWVEGRGPLWGAAAASAALRSVAGVGTAAVVEGDVAGGGVDTSGALSGAEACTLPPPSFAAGNISPYVEMLAKVFGADPRMDPAVLYTHALMWQVQHGQQVDPGLLGRAAFLRAAVESARTLNLAAARAAPSVPYVAAGPWRQRVGQPALALSELDALDEEERADVLLAQALRQVAATAASSGRGPAVAVIEVRWLDGIRQHWARVLAPDAAGEAQSCFVAASALGLTAPEEAAQGWLHTGVGGVMALAAAGMSMGAYWAGAFAKGGTILGAAKGLAASVKLPALLKGSAAAAVKAKAGAAAAAAATTSTPTASTGAAATVASVAAGKATGGATTAAAAAAAKSAGTVAAAAKAAGGAGTAATAAATAATALSFSGASKLSSTSTSSAATAAAVAATATLAGTRVGSAGVALGGAGMAAGVGKGVAASLVSCGAGLLAPVAAVGKAAAGSYAGAKGGSAALVTAGALGQAAERGHMLAHGLVTLAKRTSVLALRSTFYNFMRGRGRGPAGRAPGLLLAGTLGTAAGLWWQGEAVERTLGTVPVAPELARLGRGVAQLREAAGRVHQSKAA